MEKVLYSINYLLKNGVALSTTNYDHNLIIVYGLITIIKVLVAIIIIIIVVAIVKKIIKIFK